jgi:hypothetical protein
MQLRRRQKYKASNSDPPTYSFPVMKAALRAEPAQQCRRKCTLLIVLLTRTTGHHGGSANLAPSATTLKHRARVQVTCVQVALAASCYGPKPLHPGSTNQ